jgi:uncharacterized phiE125 gp8 family phage protein
MIWNELLPVQAGELPLAAFREHLRLGSGFSDDGAQDGFLESVLRTALASIERRSGKILLQRDFRLVVEAWGRRERQVLPVAPVTSILSVTLRDASGASTPVPVIQFRLIEDPHRPSVAGVSGSLPAIAAGGSAEIVFSAGLGAVWAEVPPDLARATFLLAAHFHENRHAAGEVQRSLPQGVETLIEPWRVIRTFGSYRG